MRSRRGTTPRLVPPVSVVLASGVRRYIAGLVDFREGRVDDWIGAFAVGIALNPVSTAGEHMMRARSTSSKVWKRASNMAAI